MRHAHSINADSLGGKDRRRVDHVPGFTHTTWMFFLTNKNLFISVKPFIATSSQDALKNPRHKRETLLSSATLGPAHSSWHRSMLYFPTAQDRRGEYLCSKTQLVVEGKEARIRLLGLLLSSSEPQILIKSKKYFKGVGFGFQRQKPLSRCPPPTFTHSALGRISLTQARQQDLDPQCPHIGTETA